MVDVNFRWACSAVVVSAIAFGQASAADVNIGKPNWPSAGATAHVLRAVAEQELGIEVELTTGSNAVIWKAMDTGGTNTIDVHPEVWMPNQKNFANKYVEKQGSVILGPTNYVVETGYYVTESTSQKYGITSIYDLMKPKNAKLFDDDGDGQGEVWIGATGWASTEVERVRARDIGFGEFFDLLTISESAAMARFSSKVKKGEPVVTFGQNPAHYIFAEYDLVKLEEPAYDEDHWNMVSSSESTNWYEESEVSVGWPEVTVHIAWSKALQDRAPEFVDLVENIRLDASTVSNWVYSLVVEKAAPETVADEWVADNSERVSEWTKR